MVDMRTILNLNIGRKSCQYLQKNNFNITDGADESLKSIIQRISVVTPL